MHDVWGKYKVWVQEPETKRPFGRIVHKREDYFKLVLGGNRI